MTTELEVVREPERYRKTGLGRVQWWRLEREGRAPRRLQLSDNSVGWLRGELDAWIAALAAQRPSTKFEAPIRATEEANSARAARFKKRGRPASVTTQATDTTEDR